MINSLAVNFHGGVMQIINSVLIKIVVPVLILAGCSAATYEYTSTPVSQKLGTELFRAGFTPEKTRADFFSRFQLEVENLSDDPIEIDWNRTVYIVNGKNRGPFVWEGIDPERVKNKTVPKTTIPPGQSFSRTILPLAKIAMAQLGDHVAGKDEPGLYGGILPSGKNSIRLAVTANGKLDQPILTVVITEEKK